MRSASSKSPQATLAELGNTTPARPPASQVPTRTPVPPLVPATAELRYKVPDGWATERSSSTMRMAQYNLPKSVGDPEDASLILYYFGQRQGGPGGKR